MASIEELETSIRQYESQLSQVGEALNLCGNEVEKSSLENLRSDLQELLDLTRETLNEQQKGSNAEGASTNEDDDPFEQEMALLMSEINDNEAPKTPNDDDDDDDDDDGDDDNNGNDDENVDTGNHLSEELQKFKNDVDSLIGKKCSAPYTFAWGAKSYHNALVCGLETDVDRIQSMENVKVTVLFTNPIHRNMVPCPFYLDGNCRFDFNKCRFSHGESVRYVDLKAYNKPNFSLLDQIKHPVLAKQTDNIWYKGRVISSNFTDKTCQIKFEHNKKDVTCDFHDILPIEEEAPFVASSDSESSDDDDIEQIRKANIIAASLLTPSSNEALGAWEAHTKGFGSRIMQKLGYVVGTGLGQNGEGIVVPISAQILPLGRSLDHCMALRERANGDENLFSVERKLKRQQEKQEIINAKAYEREKNNRDIFNFINNTVLNNIPSTSTSFDERNAKRPKTDFKSQSTKKLNVESFKIGEDIRKMEREIQRLQESLRRQKDGTQLSQQLNMQLDIRKTELDRMRRSETCLQKEQVLRKDKSKLTIF